MNIFIISALVTDGCWAQISSIADINGLSVTEYLDLMYDYMHTNDLKTIAKVDKKTILIYSCMVHLSKVFLKDVKELHKSYHQIALTFFVEMSKITHYNDLLNMFQAMCEYFVTSNKTAQIEILDRIQLKMDERNLEFEFEIDESKPSPQENAAIYKMSPFYRDSMSIMQSTLEKVSGECSKTVINYLKMYTSKYMAYAPMWTGIVHYERSRSLKTLETYRFTNANIESFWSHTKEGIRSSVLQIGKLPLPIDRYIKYRKSETAGFILRWTKNIPKSSIATR